MDQEPELLPTETAAIRARTYPATVAILARRGRLVPDVITEDGTMLWNPVRLRRAMAEWRRQTTRGGRIRLRMERMIKPPEPPRLPNPNQRPGGPRLNGTG